MLESEGKARSNSALIVSKESGAGKEIVELEQGTKEQEVKEVVNVREEGSPRAEKTAAAAAATAEIKAAKIERLKSGFRICKPQGTFLWPNMGRNNCNNKIGTTTSNNKVSPQVVVQVVPTPPSVSFSTALAPPQLPYHPTTNNYHPPAYPVKPLAEIGAVMVTVSTSSNENVDHGYSTTANKKTTPINLNYIPCNPVEVLSGNPSSSPHTVATTTVIPRKQPTKFCCSSSASCLSTEKVMGNWLALATANAASDESGQPGLK